MSGRNRDKEKSSSFSGVRYDTIMDRQTGDKRFERERNQKELPLDSKPQTSSTFDAFKRMTTGVESRTIAEKIADPNRPTWEQFKKENENKLDFVGEDIRKMAEYRAQLDRDREKYLKQASVRNLNKKNLSSDSEDSSDDKKHKKSKKNKKNKKKHKQKKDKKLKSHDNDSNITNSSTDSEPDEINKKKRKVSSNSNDDIGKVVRLSEFLNRNSDSESN